MPFYANAQERFAEPPSTEANHSVSIDLIGLRYAYELPIARKATIIGRVGANFGAAWFTGGEWRTGITLPYGDYLMISPSIDIEPRWYYGLDRREMHSRSSAGNSGSFLSLKVQHRFPGYISDDYIRMVGTTFASPTWGLRRVWRDHWLFEFTTGLRFGMSQGYWWSADVVDRLDVNVRFGYTF
jgi:hypothetical protein